MKKAKALCKESGGDAVFPSAILHAGQIMAIDEGLNKKKPYAKIARKAGVNIKTVIRRRNKLFGFKPKKRKPKK